MSNVTSRLSQRMASMSDGKSQRAYMALIFRLAALVEPNKKRLGEWYFTTPIRQLAGLTACELTAAGQAFLVVEFLRAILTEGTSNLLG